MVAVKVFATSDLHVGYDENRQLVEGLQPESDDDWLIVAGDVGEYMADVKWVLELLAGRFHTVVWAPGNHELWTPVRDPVQLRGERRYQHLVEFCRGIGVHTPEDPFPVWDGPGGPVTIAPLMLLYDYTFRVAGVHTRQEALARAHEVGIVCTDEYLLHPDPFPSRQAWCAARVEKSWRLLAECDPLVPTVLVNHWPLIREPTRVLRYPDFALWSGTERTADWHVRFNAAAVVYGHLHIPRTTWHDGVRFEEVSLGYPREWRPRSRGPVLLRQIVPPEPTT
jgi:3',5'-cyclic AMP phosphodiesterase CpdA